MMDWSKMTRDFKATRKCKGLNLWTTPHRISRAFPADVEKTAAPAERWQNDDDPTTRRTDGTLVQVSIEHTGNETVDEKTWKLGFVEQLNEEILKRGLARPLFEQPVFATSRREYWRTLPPAWTRSYKK
jgi:hypothetical protein